jgi:hypothetical protein
MIVYLVSVQIEYGGNYLGNAKIFKNEADAIKYQEQLQQTVYRNMIEIIEMEVE